jgi:hypothetical protein
MFLQQSYGTNIELCKLLRCKLLDAAGLGTAFNRAATRVEETKVFQWDMDTKFPCETVVRMSRKQFEEAKELKTGWMPPLPSASLPTPRVLFFYAWMFPSSF